MFFGGGFSGGRRRGRERKGKDVIHQLSVTLEELYRGAVRKLALQKNVICEKCEGRGGKKVCFVYCCGFFNSFLFAMVSWVITNIIFQYNKCPIKMLYTCTGI